MAEARIVSTPAPRIRCLDCLSVNGFNGEVPPDECPEPNCNSENVEQCMDHVAMAL